MLPHRFPFRLVERHGESVAWALPSPGGTLWRGAGDVPLTLAIEMLAQAAAVLLSQDGETERRGLLIGVDRARLDGKLRAGEALRIEVRSVGHFGRLLKATGRLTDESGAALEADLLLALERDGVP